MRADGLVFCGTALPGHSSLYIYVSFSSAEHAKPSPPRPATDAERQDACCCPPDSCFGSHKIIIAASQNKP